MSKRVLRVEGSFCAAHMLPRHEGLCRNLHGHNYKVELEVGYDEVPAGKLFAADFGVIKSRLRELLSAYDHSLLLAKDTPEELYHLCNAQKWRFNFLGDDTTAESICHELLLYICIWPEIQELPIPYTITIKVWESPTAWASEERIYGKLESERDLRSDDSG